MVTMMMARTTMLVLRTIMSCDSSNSGDVTLIVVMEVA